MATNTQILHTIRCDTCGTTRTSNGIESLDHFVALLKSQGWVLTRTKELCRECFADRKRSRS